MFHVTALSVVISPRQIHQVW